MTVASFDTTEEALEGLAAELGVKGLPQVRFYKARPLAGAGAAGRPTGWQLLRWVPAAAAAGGRQLEAARAAAWRCVSALEVSLHAPTSIDPPLCLQGGQEALDKIMGYKLAPLGEAFKKLEGL